MLTVVATAEDLTRLAMSQLVRRLERQGRIASLSDPDEPDEPESETGRVPSTPAQRSIRRTPCPPAVIRRAVRSEQSIRRQLFERLDVVDRRTHADAVGVLAGS